MGLKDILWMALIICGAVYLLYRSIWKNKGHCSGCSSGTCDLKKQRVMLLRPSPKVKDGAASN